VVEVARRWPGAAAAALLGVVLAMCYAPVVFAGKSLQAPLYTASAVVPGGPWGYAGRRPANTFDVDLATPAFYEWPLNRYIGRVLRSGELPLWNPHQGAGVPVVANYSTRVFFPFQMALDVSPPALWDFFFLLRLWAAGWLTYRFLSRAGLGWTAAVFGGLGYMLSGAFVWFINLEQYVNAAMALPLWFLAVESFVARPDARRSAWAALAVGLNLLAGQPEITLYGLTAGGLYGVVRWRSGHRLRVPIRRAMVWVVVAVSTGFALAAVQLFPFAAHLPNAHHLHRSGGDMGVRDPAPPILAIQIFVPSFYELPTFLRTKPDNGSWDQVGGYAGVLAAFLLLAGLGAAPWRASPAGRAPLIFFGALAAWLLLKNFGLPPFDWIGYLPFFDQVWTPRWGGPTWCFAVAAGSSFGLQRLLETPPTATRRARILLVAAGLLVLVSTLAAKGFTALAPLQDAYWEFIWPGAIGGSLLAATVVGFATIALWQCRGAGLAVALLALLVIERWLPIPRGYPPLLLTLRFAPVGLGLAAVAFVVLRRPPAAVGSAVVALAVGLALDPFAPLGLPRRADPAAAPPVVRVLKGLARHDRIMGDARVLAPNYASVFGLYDVRHVDALAVDWFHRFVEEGLETHPRRWWHALWFVGDPERPPRSPALAPDAAAPTRLEQDLRARLRGYSLLGVRYIVAPRGMDLNRAAAGEADRFPLVYDGEALVYENRAALPRAFVATRWEAAAGPAAARARALSPDFDPRVSAVIEDASAGAGGSGGVATIAEYRPTRVRLEVDLDGAGLVVLSDTFYPGWRASVDGRPAPIHRVNGVFRGVFVDGGRHEVMMRFLPSSQMWGLGVSAAALLVVAALAFRVPHGPPRAR